jgi:serine-type D-Ala-D-Ala carboxypeptidase/endopeptidase (penicillin-binding protein 4)
MARQSRLVALVTLAMVNVITLTGGIAVAAMLPGWLNALRIPYVTPGPQATPGPVLAGGTQGQLPTTGGLRSALKTPLDEAGPGTLAMVADPETGQVLYSQGGTQLATPASTTKLVTAVAAESVLGASARFTTRVVSAPGGIILVGGGDPTLAVKPYPASQYPAPATLQDLAARTATQLKAAGRQSVRLNYDTSLYDGPGLAPGWPESYVTTGNVTQIVPLEVDQGRLTAAGAPEDDDDPYNLSPRADHPAEMAANAFAALLGQDGITVTGTPADQAAPAAATVLASVSSPPLSAIAEQMLAESNNVIAENLARHVAIATGYPATFSGAAAAEMAEIKRLGVTTGIHLVDGSGLSPQDKIAPATLVKVLRTAVATPGLRSVLAGLPVAGFSGTLAAGESVFAAIGGPALGAVRAKTGNLGDVTTLAGLADDADGGVLIFAFMADNVTNLNTAARAIDNAAEELAGCGCR